MAVDERSVATPGDYSSIFRQYVLRGAEQTLATITQESPLDTDEREQALLTLTYALDLPDAWPVTRDLLVALAPRLEKAGYREQWTPYLEQGVDRCRAAGDAAAEGELLHQLGMICQLLGQLGDARGYYEQSATCFAQVDDQHRQARALNRTALTFRLQRRLEEASRAADAAFALLPPDDPERGYTSFIWGCIALDNRDWPLAVHHYQEALDVAENAGDPRRIAWSLTNLGPALRASGRNEEAAACYERAIPILDDIEDWVNQAAARSNLGAIYLNTNQLEAALALYNQAEEVFREVHDLVRLASTTTNLSLVHRQLGQPDKAAYYAEASIHFNRQIGNDASVVNAMNCLAEAYVDAGRYEEAEAVLDEAWTLLQPIQDKPGNDILVDDMKATLALIAQRRDHPEEPVSRHPLPGGDDG
ncbi:MAG: tetratricopeptide repeat protein [Anaerolineae bacterium]|nr:tetratricopeptide repeat protein [Anaerolineae bacterium]